MTTRGRIGRALAVAALVAGVAVAHSVTRSAPTSRVHPMRPILTLNSPLLFAFDGDIFAPGATIDDSSATCSSNGGNAGDGGDVGNTTGGNGAAGTGGTGGNGGDGGDITLDDDFATGTGFATGSTTITGGNGALGGLGGLGTGGAGGLGLGVGGSSIGGAAGPCTADSGDSGD